MIPSIAPLTITGDTAVPLIASNLLKQVSSTTNGFDVNSGYSVLFITSGPLYIGGSDVSRGSSLAPAGAYPYTLRDDEVPYGLAPSGASVTIQIFGQGFKS